MDSLPADLAEPHYKCPACGEPVMPLASDQALRQCDRCGEQFFVAVDAEPETAEDEALHQRTREAELSELRIMQVSRLRRAAIRTQSWWLIAAGACLVSAAQLIFLSIHGYRSGHRAIAAVEMLAAAAILMLVMPCLRRVQELGREIRDSKLPEPTHAPDLSALSDGTQHLQNLQQLTSDE